MKWNHVTYRCDLEHVLARSGLRLHRRAEVDELCHGDEGVLGRQPALVPDHDVPHVEIAVIHVRRRPSVGRDRFRPRRRSCPGPYGVSQAYTCSGDFV